MKRIILIFFKLLHSRTDGINIKYSLRQVNRMSLNNMMWSIIIF